MRVIDKLLLEGIIFLVLFVVYMNCSDKPILFKNFWRTYFYVMIYLIPVVLFATVIPLTYNLFTFLLNLSIIIFFIELIVFNIIWINATETEWYRYCTSKLLGIIFSFSIVSMFLVTFIVKCFK